MELTFVANFFAPMPSPSDPHRPNPELTHLPVADFFNRLQLLTQLLALRDQREVRQILSQGKGVKEQPLLRSVESAVARLLKGKSRIYPATAGNAVNTRLDFVSMRSLLPAISQLATTTVEAAYQAAQTASVLSSVRYWTNPFSGDDRFDDFQAATRDHVSSLAFLRWSLRAHRLPPKDQRALRRYTEEEALVYGLHPRQQDPELQNDAGPAGLAERKARLSPQAAALISDRLRATDGAWPWLQPYGSGSSPWPFPGTLRGREDVSSLLAEAAVLDALGAQLAWPPFDGLQPFVDAGESDDEEASQHQYEEALAAWSTCLDAGLALRYLAAVLKALAQPEAVSHCASCYRYVGKSERRSRCDLHYSTSSQRNNALRLAVYTSRFRERLVELRRELSDNAVIANPGKTLADCWRLGQGVHAWPGPANPRMQGRWPAMHRDEALEQLATGLHRMVKTLAPVVGPQLHQRMLRLADAVVAHARSTIKDGEGGDVNVAPAHAPAPASSQRALEWLLPAAYFMLWFGGATAIDAPEDLKRGTDPGHPLLRLMATGAAAPATSAAAIAMQSALPLAFDFQMIVRDLIYHRAWIEAGGAEADMAIQEGKPVPTDRPRNRLDVEAAWRLREEQGKTFQEIGELFGVSRAAVYMALKKRADNVAPTLTSRRKK